MNKLREKSPKVLLVVTGSISAYKACEVVRQLQKEGVSVKAMLTESALHFVGKTTFKALTKQNVCTSQFDDTEASPHISYVHEADCICVCPATANTINKLAVGIADTLVSTSLLAADPKRLVIAPAMNSAMYQNESTQRSLQTLKNRGVLFVGPATGELADGEVGVGHIAEVDEICAEVLSHIRYSNVLMGKKVVITLGPTQEPLDPVRFISNRSSGNMGAELANACVAAGATVVAITGPCEAVLSPRVHRIPVTSAQEMLTATQQETKDADAFFSVAAVCDVAPVQVATHKLKKGSTMPKTLELTENPDIVATIKRERPELLCVGFAAETQDVIEHAYAKLHNKQLDAIVACDVLAPSSGFGKPSLMAAICEDHTSPGLKLTSKQELANNLVRFVAARLPKLEGK